MITRYSHKVSSHIHSFNIQDNILLSICIKLIYNYFGYSIIIDV